MGKYTNLGCFKDHSSRAIAGGFVRYAPSTAIYQCYQKALRLGNQYFAVQYNTECFTHRDAGRTYAKYGRANGCRNGRGGGWKMNVYRINGPVSSPVRGCSVEIFEHANYHGGREVYRGDVRRVRHNDRMSSLKVPNGCCLTIYEHYNFGGRNHRYCSQNVGFVGGWWNDRVSSLKVSGRGGDSEVDLPKVADPYYGLSCDFKNGDGAGYSEVKIGLQTGEHCVQACIRYKHEKDGRVNGVTILQNGRGGCWCELNMKSRSSSHTYKTCFLPHMTPNYSCNFINGDGAGGSEVKIGLQVGEGCIQACIRYKHTTDNRVNGVTLLQSGQGGCWC